jgi:hypothetical protein
VLADGDDDQLRLRLLDPQHNEHELMAAAQRHAREVNGVSIAADQALAMAYPAASEDAEGEP